MINSQLSWLYSLSIFLVIFCKTLKANTHDVGTLKTTVYFSPEMVMKPGSVINKFHNNMDFPRGHIGIKSFDAEVVDETGVPVSLHDTYLHHWLVARYYLRIGSDENGLRKSTESSDSSDVIWALNSGVCKNLGQYFAQGSETRKTSTRVPDPYAIEVGNPDEIPQGYEERWMINIHAIDTRGAVDRLACTECHCSHYNVTLDQYGIPISPGYAGGLLCCYDGTHCKVKEGFELSPRKVYLKYTVKWFDWNKSILPVNIYIFDITDTWKAPNGKHECKVTFLFFLLLFLGKLISTLPLVFCTVILKLSNLVCIGI